MSTKEGRVMLGWCLTHGIEQHRRCRVTVGKYTCECTECGDEHGADKEVLPSGVTSELREIMRQHGMMDEKTHGRARPKKVVEPKPVPSVQVDADVV